MTHRLPRLATRRPIRLRLSLLYGAIVFVVGAVLMVVAYTIVEHNLTIYSHRVTSAQANGRPPLSLPRDRRGHALADLEAFLRRQGRREAAIEQTARIDARDSVAAEFLIALIALTLPSAALGYVLAGRALRPVAAITAAAQRVAAGDLSNRIALAGPRDELGQLADTFDAMLERLEAAFARQQAFVANASHELKTPLAIVRAELDATLSDPASSERDLRNMAATISEATARSELLIERLLLLAQSERSTLHWQHVDLDRVVRRVLGDLNPAAGWLHVKISLSLGGPIPWGDEVLLTSLVRNLAENAIRHNIAGGTVEITTVRRDGLAILTVESDGVAIPAARVDQLFEPFHRLDRTAGTNHGSGLGLAIVKTVVTAHGGEIRAKARSAGGLHISVAVPLASDAHGGEGRAVGFDGGRIRSHG
jgi:signal transduction histidine kinase